MRVVLAIAIAIVASSGTAESVRARLPWVVEECSQAMAWDKIATCLGRHGDVVMISSTKAAKLVRVTERKSATAFGGDLGLYLFVAHGQQWQLGGMYEALDGYQSSSLSPLVVGHHTGWRIDLKLRSDTTVTLDNATGMPAIWDRKLSVLCAGTGYNCTEVMTSCDVLVHGKALRSFRGKLTFEHDNVQILGDRSNAGTDCAMNKELALDWNQ